MPAADAVFQEHAVRAVLRVLEICRGITIEAIDAADAKLAFPDPVTPADIDRTVYAVGVITVPVLVGVENHVAVFVFSGVIRVLAVFIQVVSREKRRPGADVHQLFELREERPVEIEIASILKRIPAVSEPDILLVNLVRTFGRKNGDYRLTREAAGSLIKRDVIYV